MPAAEAAAARMDSGRPVPMTMTSKVDGSMGGYDAASSMAAKIETEREIVAWQLSRVIINAVANCNRNLHHLPRQ